VIGMALGFTAIDPIQALFWSAVINGVIAVPIMGVMMLMASNRAVMGDFVVGRRLRWLGWAGTGLMAMAVGAMLLTL
jgi:Mn2+/Fe2+ NRAMP family transporter